MAEVGGSVRNAIGHAVTTELRDAVSVVAGAGVRFAAADVIWRRASWIAVGSAVEGAVRDAVNTIKETQ